MTIDASGSEPGSWNRRAILALLGGALAIGVAPIWVRLSELGPSATAFYRLLFALPVFWCWLGWDHYRGVAPSHPPSLLDVAHLFGAGVFFALDMAFWHWSLHLTTVANSTLLTNAAPIFVTLGAWWWFREAITGTFLTGLALAIAGAAVLSGASISQSTAQLRGDGIALLAAVFYGGYMLYVKRLRQRFSPMTIMAWSGIASTVSLGVITVLWGESLAVSSQRGWMILILLALTGQVAGQTLIAYAFKHLPASFSAVGLLLQPAVAAGLGWVILHEAMGPSQLVGGGVVLTGIYLCQRGSR